MSPYLGVFNGEVSFKEWLYGPKNQWLEEPRKVKKKKKERVIYKAPAVMCEYGVKSNYGLVPSELGIDHLLRPYG